MEGARPAAPADLARLAELAQAARDELAPARGGSLLFGRELGTDHRSRLAEALEASDAHVVAGTLDDAVTGYAVVAAERLEDGRLLGRIGEIYVEPGARQVGVGEAMIEQILGWCRERGCSGIDALVLPGTRATKNFFETFGFTARLLVVHHELAP